MKLTSDKTIITKDVVSFLRALEDYFTMGIKRRLGLKEINIEEFYILSNLPCYMVTYNKLMKSVHYLIHMSVFIEQFVSRVKIEHVMIMMTTGNHKIPYKDDVIFLQAEISVEAYITPILIKNANFQDTCFIRRARNVNFVPYQNYRLVPVSKVLLCEQIELDQHEYTMDQLKLEVFITRTNKILTFDQYKLLSKGRMRVCMEDIGNIIFRKQQNNDMAHALGIVTFISTVLSLTGLFLTFSVYCLCPKLRTTPGLNNMMLIMALFVSQVSFQFSSTFETSGIACEICGIITHLSWLSVFMWMNVCSFHMFRSFSGIISIQPRPGKRSLFTMLKYGCYAFGGSVLVVLTNVLIAGFSSDWTVVGYGHEQCFIDDRLSFILAFMCPVVIICVTNLGLFIITAYRIHKTPTIESCSIDRRHFDVYVKLFVITGVTWLLVIVESFLPLSALSFVATVLNGCQGVYIFVSYACNQRTWSMIRMRLKSMRLIRTLSDVSSRFLRTSTTTNDSTGGEQFNKMGN